MLSKYFERALVTALSQWSPFPLNDVVSITGKVVFKDDLDLKVKVLDTQLGVKGIYKNVDNPVFEVFYVDAEEV